MSRKAGQRESSIRNFRNFRVTWITLALTAGGLELVEHVSCHRTVEVVMKRYFRPGREDFRRTMMKVMPKMPSDGGAQGSVKDQALAIVEALSAKTWRRDQAQLVRVLSAL